MSPAFPRRRSVSTLLRRVVLPAALLVVTAPALAQGAAPAAPQNVVTLAASASLEMTMDWLTVTLGTTRDGPEAAAVQAQVRQALDAALTEARKAARPGELLVRTGGFALHPRYGTKAAITGWQGSAELVLEGRDTAAIAQLAGRLQTLAITRVQWSLSREAREKVEGEVTAQAIARFRARADEVARHFGSGGWTVREVNVADHGQPPADPGPRMRMQAMAAAPAEALPVEAGRTLVTVTVSGSVQLR